MSFFDWDERFSVGVTEIDDQHKRLVALLNELYEAMYSGQGREALGHVLAGLVGYAGTHFAAEERLMRLHRYPEAAGHKDKHDKMAAHVTELRERFDAGAIASPVQISNFLKGWLSRHIMETDRRFGAFLNEKGVR